MCNGDCYKLVRPCHGIGQAIETLLWAVGCSVTLCYVVLQLQVIVHSTLSRRLLSSFLLQCILPWLQHSTVCDGDCSKHVYPFHGIGQAIENLLWAVGCITLCCDVLQDIAHILPSQDSSAYWHCYTLLCVMMTVPSLSVHVMV